MTIENTRNAFGEYTVKGKGWVEQTIIAQTGYDAVVRYMESLYESADFNPEVVGNVDIEVSRDLGDRIWKWTVQSYIELEPNIYIPRQTRPVIELK